MQLQIAAEPSVPCCHLANTNEDLDGLATAVCHITLVCCYYYGNVLQERDNFAAQCDESKKQLTAQRTGSKHLEDLIDKLQQDKKRLGLRVNKLTTTGIQHICGFYT